MTDHRNPQPQPRTQSQPKSPAGARPATRPTAVNLHLIGPAAMTALLGDDLAAASESTGAQLTGYFTTDKAKWLWRYRLNQVEQDPGSAAWFARAAVAEPGGEVVGHCGFHGPPDEGGMVEVGYSVDPAFRRRGYATAMLGALLARCAADPSVRTVRASVSPDNAASLAVIAHFGFCRVGEQVDEEDGLEFVFEVSAGSA